MGTLTAGKISIGNTTTGLELDTLNGISAFNSGTQTLHFKPDGTGYIGASQDISWDGSGNVSVSGELGAGSIFTNGQIKSVNGGVEVVLGPKDFGAEGVYLLSGTNSVDDLVFGVDENGNATFKGQVDATSGVFGNEATGEYIKYENGVFEAGPNTNIGSNIDRVFTVGVGGDFPTINDALTFVSKTVPAYKKDGFIAEIRLLTGFVIQEQVIISDIDLSWVEITSEDSLNLVDKSYLTNSIKSVFIVQRGAKSPKIKLGLDFQSWVAGQDYSGFYSTGPGSVLWAESCDVRNANKGFQSNFYSTLQGLYCATSGCQYGGYSDLGSLNLESISFNGGYYGVYTRRANVRLSGDTNNNTIGVWSQNSALETGTFDSRFCTDYGLYFSSVTVKGSIRASDNNNIGARFQDSVMIGDLNVNYCTEAGVTLSNSRIESGILTANTSTPTVPIKLSNASSVVMDTIYTSGGTPYDLEVLGASIVRTKSTAFTCNLTKNSFTSDGYVISSG
jgi:hypothetical protein